MIIYLSIVALFLFHYSWLILKLSRSKNEVSLKSTKKPQIYAGITILIPFRNELFRIQPTLNSLLALHYPTEHFEVLFINDHSKDEYEPLFSPFLNNGNIKLIENKGKGKKAAIETGINNARHPWILCTDADCSFDSGWLNRCNELITQTEGDLFVLPVIIGNDGSIIQSYQFYESLSSFAVTKGYYYWKNKVLLASGANLLYKKDVFIAIDPYKENKGIASGDDMFLLEGFKKAGKRIIFSDAKGLWVRSIGESNWGGIMRQRIRWVKKMRHLSSQSSFLVGAYFLSFQVILLILAMLSIGSPLISLFFLLIIFIKSILDFNLIKKETSKNEMPLRWEMMFLLEFVYLFAMPFIGILAMLWHPKWKGRKIGS
jgi:glycosyltransferase involved in cell wall biosynthesis